MEGVVYNEARCAHGSSDCLGKEVRVECIRRGGQLVRHPNLVVVVSAAASLSPINAGGPVFQRMWEGGVKTLPLRVVVVELVGGVGFSAEEGAEKYCRGFIARRGYRVLWERSDGKEVDVLRPMHCLWSGIVAVFIALRGLRR